MCSRSKRSSIHGAVWNLVRLRLPYVPGMCLQTRCAASRYDTQVKGLRAGFSSGGAALAAVILALGLQSLIVFYRFDGNWTGWFCTGSQFPVPPQLVSERLYVFPSSPGYDGQMYHYLAHDPFLRSDLHEYMDAPR